MKISLNELALLSILHDSTSLSYPQLVRAYEIRFFPLYKDRNVLSTTIRKSLSNLRKHGLIKRTGDRRHYQYSLSTKGVLALIQIKEQVLLCLEGV